MTRLRKIITISLSIISLLVASGIYLLYNFISAFSPPKLTMTTKSISTNRNFINGLTIEKLKVDSIGDENYPVKYTVVYATSCKIYHPTNKPPDPPSKIEFNKSGKYSWDEDTTKIRYIHNGLSRQPLDRPKKLWCLSKFGDNPVCPLKFQREQWYFITISDPRVTGIFFYIDKNGKESQFYLKSGISPI